MAGMSLLRDRLEQYKCEANSVVYFKLIRSESDIENDDLCFHPEMSHQIFGENESIFGYRDLRIDVLYTAAKLKTYIKISYLDKICPKKFDGVYADDVERHIAKTIPSDYTTNLDLFTKEIPKEEDFKPFGEKLHEYSITKDGAERKFEIYRATIEEPGFRNFQEHLQPFLLWYVDAASFIDVDDDRWNYYLIFEKYQKNGKQMYATVGYMTVYNYFAYPEKHRPRISQVLILPPFQKQGHGAQLLQTFYNDISGRPDILDVTVEDPNEDFQRLRDFVDCRNSLKLRSFSKANLKKGFTVDMANECQNKLKLNKRQSRRVYEILRLQATDCSNKEEWRGYRIEIKKRLNIPFQRSGREINKLNRTLQESEVSALANLNVEQRQERMNYLQREFDDTLTQYRRIVERLATV